MEENIFRLPLEVIELDNLSYHILVEGEMNGLPCNLIIDTGASRTVFDRNYFEDEVEILEIKTDDLADSWGDGRSDRNGFCQGGYIPDPGFPPGEFPHDPHRSCRHKWALPVRHRQKHSWSSGE